MEIASIIAALGRFPPVPRTEIHTVTVRREEFLAPLLHELRGFVETPGSQLSDEQWRKGLMALFIFAMWREEAAADLVMQLFLQPEEELESKLADIVTEFGDDMLSRILGSARKDDLCRIADSAAGSWVRGAAEMAMVRLELDGRLPAGFCAGELRRIHDQLLAHPRDEHQAKLDWVVWADAVCSGSVTELLPLVRLRLSDGHVDRTFLDEADVAESEENPEAERRATMKWTARLDDIEEACSWCYEEQEQLEEGTDDYRGEPLIFPASAPPEPGRNDPCPCGSGKKYKKCCLS